MKRGYFTTLAICVFLSIAVLGLTTYSSVAPRWHFPPWLGMTLAALPLFYYHIGYLRPRAAAGLSSAAIDSVYYFGFLITIGALSSSALTIAINGDATNIGDVVYQFGVGLIATGYAVIARMHLMSLTSASEALSPESVIDGYVRHSQQLVDNVEDAAKSFSDFSKRIMAESEHARTVSEKGRADAERATADTRQSLLTASRDFQSSMSAAVGLAMTDLEDLRAAIRDSAFRTEREELANTLRVTVGVTTQVNAAMADLAIGSGNAARSTSDIARTAILSEQALLSLSNRVESVGGQSGPFNSAVLALGEATQAISQGTATIGVVMKDLAEAASAITDAAKGFKEMRKVAEQAAAQLDQLALASGKAEVAGDGFGRVATASKSLASELAGVSSAFAPLSENAESLVAQMDRLKATIRESVERLEADVKRSAEASALLTENLVQVAQTLIDRARSR